MNISQLETLITISKTMSFRKAGELLNLTQPAVSAQIKSLEDEFKTVLVDRNQPVTLTDRGEVFLSHAERILAIVEELKERLYDLDQTPQGHIVLGTTTSIAIQILPRVLSYFQNQFPLIKTSIMSMASSQIYTSVENGQIDVGLGYLIERNPNLMTSVLYYDTFELIVSPRHPLARKTAVTIDVLRETPLILLSPDTVGRRFADDILKKHGIEPNVVMELSSSEEIKRMVEIDLGAAIMSKQSVASELRLGTLKIIPLTELEVSHPVGVIYKSGKYLNSAMQQFLSDLKGMPETNFISSE
ncbi:MULTISPECIES: LysR family transcriptional regulator [Paenibacillus]|uniref:DNA-binding transcriptional LysR family regulator n=3 Tax=cellular organisms TaxID=131567 RepID=A0A1R1EEP1_9BACL|nr:MULTISPECIES: LysR family transcriptional regulator [Paenibacillus]MBB3131685.1 DNA-binding transcriptional LysR family regulator [Paenibacillus rhizosphaerae]OMF50300.1 LysR family transcriptional regulator [Paenibacillus rhizosphaerae]OXL85313.1 LysR family transcriptional regulator [Paenibacillus sp. SSG-1]UYO06984.1 LysR family transcriptional regulator [Paenibacillus sp. PSB04]GIO57836.1 LysR family transcriptional regulator [Paenibacillus cineris]